MKISSYAVKNYQFTLIIFIMIAVLGMSTIINMPRSEDPEMHAPVFAITVIYPGASPTDMEDLVVEPLEKEIYQLENIKRLRTIIGSSYAVIQVDYRYGSDVENKYQELTRLVNSKQTELPGEIQKLEVRKFQPSDVNILQVALISENAPKTQLRTQAEELQKKLEKIADLKNVTIHGLPYQQVKIELNLEKMAESHIPLMAVLGNLQSEIANIPGGSIEAGANVYNVKTSGSYKNLEEISSTIVFAVNQKNVQLKDIANVYYGYEDEQHITRLNGHRCILVTAALKDKANISKAQKAYKPVLQQFEKNLPQNVDLIANFDQADNVNKRLSGLGMDFLIAIGLVAITLLPLGARPALIVMISIPLSLAIGVILLNLFGYNLNQLSIVGLVVALGLLVDDSIVVVENIERWMLDGYSRTEAVLKATKQIGLAVIGCTATLIIAFLPIAFMPEAAGDFIRSLPLAVMFAVLASMLVSLTIIPFLSSRMLKQHPGNRGGNIFMRALKKGIHKSYAPLLERALKRPWTTITIAALIFVGSLGIFRLIGFSLFPASEKPQFLINISTPPQSNLAHTNEIAQQVEAILEKDTHIQYYTTNVGKGNPRVYYNEMQGNQRNDFAQIFVQLQPWVSPKDKLVLLDYYRRKWSPFTGAKVEVKNFEQGTPVVAPIEVRVSGPHLDTLRRIAAEVEHILLKTQGAIYVNNPLRLLKSDLRVHINKEKAQMFGVVTSDIDRVIRLAVAGVTLGRYNDENGSDYDIVVTKGKEGRPSLATLQNLFVNNQQGQLIPLSQLTELQMEQSPVNITRHEKQRMVAITAFVQKGYLVDRVLRETISHMDHLKLPAGYSYTLGGEVEARADSFGDFGTIIIITIFLFIAVLILEFRTFKSTLIVLSVIPLGIVGAAIALWITGNSLSFVAVVGLIALAGIEVKNTILLVDFTNQLRSQGRDLDTAIREAGEVRFLPIVLTSLTAIGGLIPIAISTNPLISPLAIVLIGGLISSTLLSRVVTPVIYKLLPPAVATEGSKV